MAPKSLGATERLPLADTDVLIDFRRGTPEAGAWWSSLGTNLPTVPGIVAMEFIGGSINGRQLERARRFLGTLNTLWHDEKDHELAYNLTLLYRLSSGLSLADFLIAAQALNRKATLYTFNLKHFGAIPGLDARAPYFRNAP